MRRYHIKRAGTRTKFGDFGDIFAARRRAELLNNSAETLATVAGEGPFRVVAVGLEATSCIDCGESGELTGHQECQYPGRYSDRMNG